MKVVLQRVSSASVEVDEQIIGQIQGGILALCGFGSDDTTEVLGPMLEKIANMRIFPDQKGRFDQSLHDTSGQLLLVPQFTLYADTTKGRRPEFFKAKAPDEASKLFAMLCTKAEELLPGKVQNGAFGANMQVKLVNDGPVTIPLEMNL